MISDFIMQDMRSKIISVKAYYIEFYIFILNQRINLFKVSFLPTKIYN